MGISDVVTRSEKTAVVSTHRENVDSALPNELKTRDQELDQGKDGSTALKKDCEDVSK